MIFLKQNCVTLPHLSSLAHVDVKGKCTGQSLTRQRLPIYPSDKGVQRFLLAYRTRIGV